MQGHLLHIGLGLFFDRALLFVDSIYWCILTHGGTGAAKVQFGCTRNVKRASLPFLQLSSRDGHAFHHRSNNGNDFLTRSPRNDYCFVDCCRRWFRPVADPKTYTGTACVIQKTCTVFWFPRKILCYNVFSYPLDCMYSCSVLNGLICDVLSVDT